MTLLGVRGWLNRTPQAVADVAEPPREYELVIALKDGSVCYEPVRTSGLGDHYAVARTLCHGVLRQGGIVEGPRDTFRMIIPADVVSVSVRERPE